MNISSAVSAISLYPNEIARNAYVKASYPYSPIQRIQQTDRKVQSNQTDIIIELNSLKTFNDYSSDVVYSPKGKSQIVNAGQNGQHFDFFA